MIDFLSMLKVIPSRNDDLIEVCGVMRIDPFVVPSSA
jgi:hypothetical protein